MRDTRFQKGHEKIGGFVSGSQHSSKSKQLISNTLVGKTGVNARRWKGDTASYHAKHMWVKKHYGKPVLCEQAGCVYPKLVNAGRELLLEPKRYEWANVSGDYKRERTDWVQLCPSCHRKVDMGKLVLCVQ